MPDTSVVIDRLAYGGAGFGRIDGKACFVPFTAPGDHVRIGVRHETASYVHAEALSIEERSPYRVSPACPVFGRCGGCHWQHLEYRFQCRAKEEIFADSLWRLARVDRQAILPLVPAREPWGYRTRIQLKLYGRGERFHVGFFAPGTHYVVDLPGGCAVAHAALNRAVDELRGVIDLFPERDRLPQIDLATGDDGHVVATAHYIGPRPDAAALFWRDHRAATPSLSGFCLQRGRTSTIRTLYGTRELSYPVPADVNGTGKTMTMSFSAGSFSQVNYRQNETLVRMALEWTDLSGSERVLDLCCGNGNFTLPLAWRAREVVGLETAGQSVRDACRNAAENGVVNVRFREQDGAQGIREFAARGETFDLVILDPPRSGAAAMMEPLVTLAPRRILYISCEPQTLGRDLARLVKGGYRVMKSRAVDLFPQTYHLESITLLEQ